MALFFPDSTPLKENGRLIGFDRYRELLEREFINYFQAGLVTIAGCLPFAAAVFYAIATSSVLLLIPGCILSGLVMGPCLYALYDMIYRTLRDASFHWWKEYRRAVADHWRSALLPGVVLSLFLGFVCFTAMLFYYWAVTPPSLGTVVMFFASLVLAAMIFSVYFPQLVLFSQSNGIRLKNCLLFCIQYFWRTLGPAVLQVGFWVVMALFMPWSLFLLPIIGIWFILFAANFLLYRDLDQAFRIEEQIRAAFPDQIPDYEEEEKV